MGFTDMQRAITEAFYQTQQVFDPNL